MNEIKPQEAASVARVTSRLRPSLELGRPAVEVTIPRPTAMTWSFAALSAVGVCAMVCAGILSAHDCRVRPIRLALGHDQDVSIALPANTPCTISVQSGSTVLDDIIVDAAAEHGTLTPRSRTEVIYRPRAGFRGSDSFDFSLRSGPNSAHETSIVRVRAIIR
jgi:hypothetical protein